MEFPERISEKLTKSIANILTDLPEEKLEQINYGIAVSITGLYKVILLFVLAYLVGVFKWMLIGFFSFGFLRTFATGLHAKKEWTCNLEYLDAIRYDSPVHCVSIGAFLSISKFARNNPNVCDLGHLSYKQKCSQDHPNLNGHRQFYKDSEQECGK